MFDFNEFYFDVDGDGTDDAAVEEFDFDGDGDAEGRTTLIDSNGDGLVDVVYKEFDINNDGYMDVVFSEAISSPTGFQSRNSRKKNCIHPIFFFRKNKFLRKDRKFSPKSFRKFFGGKSAWGC